MRFTKVGWGQEIATAERSVRCVPISASHESLFSAPLEETDAHIPLTRGRDVPTAAPQVSNISSGFRHIMDLSDTDLTD